MNERNFAIDFLRLTAILGVVVIHVGSTFLDRVLVFSPSFYAIYAVNLGVRFCVPLFFFISGLLLASRYEDIKSPGKFYKKRLLKIIPPYFIWCLLYYFFVYHHPDVTLFSEKFINNLITGDFSYQLYFIPAIIILYVLFPFIILYKKLFLNLKFLILLALLEGALFATVFIRNDNSEITSPLRNAAYNLLPFMAGMYAAVKKIEIFTIVKKNLALVIAAILLLWMMIFYEAYIHMKNPSSLAYLRNAWKLNVLVYGIFIGGLLYYVFEKFIKPYAKIVTYFSKYSFGVFFVHVAVLHFLVLYIIDPFKLYNIAYYLTALIAVIAVSFGFSIILARNKLLGRFLGVKG